MKPLKEPETLHPINPNPSSPGWLHLSLLAAGEHAGGLVV